MRMIKLFKDVNLFSVLIIKESFRCFIVLQEHRTTKNIEEEEEEEKTSTGRPKRKNRNRYCRSVNRLKKLI